MRLFLFTIFSFLLNLNIISQISEGGIPYSFSHRNSNTINEVSIPPPSNKTIASFSNNDKGPYCIGILKATSLNPNNCGTWLNHPDGSRSWKLRIKSNNAKALTLKYKHFTVPNGAELFLYNENKNQVVGKFTSSRNTLNPITHTQLIQGETTIIEYHEPANTYGKFNFHIEEIGYVFRGFEDYLKAFKDPKGNKNTTSKADPCQIDVACSPENNGWTDQIDAVVHFTFPQGGGLYVCSASTVNNTAQDCKPYILTAWHCGEHTANQSLSGYTWYWNYQKTTCQPNSNATNPSKGNETMINGVVKSTSGSGTLNSNPTSNQVAGSDFTLVELSSNIPTSYNAYYAGWDKSTSSASSGVTIHHPSGSAKKISTYTSSPYSGTYNNGAYNAHWVVTWSQTSNGHGVTEGGSSGAPIFNQNKRIIGQLSGGSSYCTSTSSPDLFGKFSTNWTSNGSSSSSQLASWLDPNNTNASNLDGTYAPCGGSSLTCSATSSITSINTGNSIDFYGTSSSSSSTWSWDFDPNNLGGVSPSNSTTQNPTGITFNNAGSYDVELTVSSGSNTCTSTVTITVNSSGTSGGCDQLNNVQANQSLVAYQYGTGYVSGWNSYGDISKADLFTISNNNQTNVNKIAVYFYGLNSASSNATVDFNIWSYSNGQPGTILGSVTHSLSNLASAVSGSNNSGLFEAVFTSPINISGNQFFAGITMNNFSSQDQLGILTNYDGSNSSNTAWEQWSSGNWYEYDASNGWGYTLAHYIIAEMSFTPTISSDQTICQGDNATINASGAGSGGTYAWDNNVGSGATQVVSPNSSTVYTVTMTDANGCAISVSTNVFVTPSPQVSATCNTLIESVNVDIDFYGTASNANQYQWDFGDGNTSTNLNAVHAYSNTGNYQVTFTGYNGNCFDQDYLSLDIINNNTGIDSKRNDNLVLYPNPNYGSFNLEITNKTNILTHLFIYNHLGKVIHTIELPSSTSSSLNIQLNNIKSGVYYLKTNNNKLYKKIIIL